MTVDSGANIVEPLVLLIAIYRDVTGAAAVIAMLLCNGGSSHSNIQPSAPQYKTSPKYEDTCSTSVSNFKITSSSKNWTVVIESHIGEICNSNKLNSFNWKLFCEFCG